MDWMYGLRRNAYFHIDQKQVKLVSVYFRPSTCGVKDCRQEYDGLEDHILNVTDSYLISHDLLYDCIDYLQGHQTTLTAFVEVTMRVRFRANNHVNFPKHQFYKAYWSFLGLLRLRNEAEQFSCYECKKAKRMVITCDRLQMGSSW